MTYISLTPIYLPCLFNSILMINVSIEYFLWEWFKGSVILHMSCPFFMFKITMDACYHFWSLHFEKSLQHLKGSVKSHLKDQGIKTKTSMEILASYSLSKLHIKNHWEPFKNCLYYGLTQDPENQNLGNSNLVQTWITIAKLKKY